MYALRLKTKSWNTGGSWLKYHLWLYVELHLGSHPDKQL